MEISQEIYMNHKTSIRNESFRNLLCTAISLKKLLSFLKLDNKKVKRVDET